MNGAVKSKKEHLPCLKVKTGLKRHEKGFAVLQDVRNWRLKPVDGQNVFVNSARINSEMDLESYDVVSLGEHNVFIFKDFQDSDCAVQQGNLTRMRQKQLSVSMKEPANPKKGTSNCYCYILGEKAFAHWTVHKKFSVSVSFTIITEGAGILMIFILLHFHRDWRRCLQIIVGRQE